jgi:hypothetical protein
MRSHSSANSGIGGKNLPAEKLSFSDGDSAK